MKAIIPCAGFGTRVGMNPNESKEMLFLNNEGAPCIDYALNLCKKYNLEPLIITRAEKTDLINYCRSLGIFCLIIDPSGEWADTVYYSRVSWQKDNILILPDTRWSSESAFKTLIDSEEPMAFGLHAVYDPQNWGILSQDYIIEKPKALEGPHLAWGVIKFSKRAGMKFFKDLATTKIAKATPCSIVKLGSFQDLTRVKI